MEVIRSSSTERLSSARDRFPPPNPTVVPVAAASVARSASFPNTGRELQWYTGLLAFCLFFLGGLTSSVQAQTPALVFTPSDLTVAEGDDASYTVALATQPSATVTVTITKSGSSGVTLNDTPLTFTTSNWSTAQTVRTVIDIKFSTSSG